MLWQETCVQMFALEIRSRPWVLLEKDSSQEGTHLLEAFECTQDPIEALLCSALHGDMQDLKLS